MGKGYVMTRDTTTNSIYRVHYRDHSDEQWSVMVVASSAAKAEEMVSQEEDCKRVIYGEMA